MIYVIQISFFLAACCAVQEEFAFTWPFREIKFKDSIEEDKQLKKSLSLKFHRWGFAEVFIYSIACSASAFFLYSNPWKHFFLSVLVAGLIYMNVFNMGYSLKLKKGLFYLGQSSEQDHWLNTKLGRVAGKIVVFVSVGLIIFINIIN